ncbi:hypothetical protein HBB16_05145 [Pseudonocardia sp. MCCB 268]|nr:hypothetical protein [Pseudonocardia cytotoxica]
MLVAAALVRAFWTRAAEPFTAYQQVQAGIMTRLLDAHRRVRHHPRQRHRRARRSSGSWRPARAARRRPPGVGPAGAGHPADVPAGPGHPGPGCWASAWPSAPGSITPGELVAAASPRRSGPAATGLADSLVFLLGCQVGAGRVGQVLEAPPAVPAPPAPELVPVGLGGWLELRATSPCARWRTHRARPSRPVGAG